MNPAPNSTLGQEAFEQGMVLVNKGYRDQGEAHLQEAARQGHPIAARAIIETRLANKAVGLAQAGQRSLALACLNEAQRQTPPPSAQVIAQLRQIVEKFQEGQFVQPKDKEGWNNMGMTYLWDYLSRICQNLKCSKTIHAQVMGQFGIR
jgi:tetratricopeptide (TPR) repeat protein